MTDVWSPETKECKYCKMQIAKDAKVCPYCRKNQGVSVVSRVIGAVLLVIALSRLFTLWDFGGNSNSTRSFVSSESYNMSKRKFKKSCESVDYEDLFRNNTSYNGTKVKFTGEINQVVSDTGNYWYYLIAVTLDEYGIYEDNVYVALDKTNADTKYLEGDIVTFYGEAAKTYTYTSVLGQSIEVPRVNALYMDLGENNESDSDDGEQDVQVGDSTEEESEERTKIEIEETEIYNDNGVSITANSMDDDGENTNVYFTVENNGDKDIHLCIESYSVDGVMVSDMVYGFDVADISPGKKAKTSISILDDWLDLYGLSEIGNIDIIFMFYDDVFEECYTPILNIKTNLSSEESYKDIYDDALYDDSNVSVWYLGSIVDNEYVFVLKNKCGDTTVYSVENCSVNEWSYNLDSYMLGLYGIPIQEDTLSFFTIRIDDNFLQEYDISNVESIEFNIEIGESKTDKIKFEL